MLFELCWSGEKKKKKKNHSEKPYILLIAASFTGAQGNR